MEVELVENVLVCSGDEHGQASIPGHCPFQLRANTGLSLSEVSPSGLLTARSSCHTSVKNEERWSRKLARRGGCMASQSGRFQRLPAHPLHREWSPEVEFCRWGLGVGLVPRCDPSLSGSPVPLQTGSSVPLLTAADGKSLQIIRCLVV